MALAQAQKQYAVTIVHSAASRRIPHTGFCLSTPTLVLQRKYANLPSEPFTPNPLVGRRKDKRKSSTDWTKFISLEIIEQKLGITQPEEWLTVNLTDARDVGLPKWVKIPQLVDLLKQRYPSQDWHKISITKGRYGKQRRVQHAVETLFPGVEIIVNARKQAGIINPITGAALELDIFLPSLNLAFEYQERHHYLKETEYAIKPLEDVQSRDQLKHALTAKSGITLVTVPCWWDGQLDSLAATIKAQRPDLSEKMTVTGEADVISTTPPSNFFVEHVKEIADIGEATNPCFFVTANTDPTNWWVFEKYDGIRGFWNPLKKAMYARTGNKMDLPQNIIDSMPSDLFLDGELWFGRDKLQEAMKIAHRVDHDQINWSSFKYMVFDLPTSKGSYEERYSQLRTALGDQPHKFISLAPFEVCKDTPHLEKIFQDIMDNGGEGVILRDPECPYQPGRTSGYLKHKKYRDAEARIVGTASAITWECELPNGVHFVASAGTTEFAKRWNPQPGDIVSFKHRGFMFGSKKPKMPTLYRVRNDMAWDDVIQSWKENVIIPRARPIRNKQRNHKLGHWKKAENRKEFLLEFAKRMSFDPMVADNWRNQRRHLLADGAGSLLERYGGSVKAMLNNTFPSLQFTEPELARHSHSQKSGYWADREHRRNFLLAFAEKVGFDPMIKSNWQGRTAKLHANQGTSILARYAGSIDAMLADTFPEMYPETGAADNWADAENRRNFLTTFSSKMGFDPMVAGNWRCRPKLRALGGAKLLERYDGNIQAMLADTFPGFLDQPKAKVKGQKIRYWTSLENRRKHLLAFAAEMGFDPMVLANWRGKTAKMTANQRGGILHRYGGSLEAMLMDTLPELFQQETKEFATEWEDLDKRKQFLISFAEKQGFDPLVPGNWNFSVLPPLRCIAGGAQLLNKYNGNVQDMITDTFPSLKAAGKRKLQKSGHWSNRENRRQFLLKFAEELGFDPMIKSNWKGKTSKIHSNEGGGLLFRYGGSIDSMLADTFPEIFQQTKETEDTWEDVEKRKQFLLGFANKVGFDPLVPDNWHSKKVPQLRAYGGSSLLTKYGDVMLDMAADTFPDLRNPLLYRL